MNITSSAFQNDQPIPARYGNNEENVNPPLEFLNVPEEAESLALILHDPDAPGGDFIHWVVYRIDPDVMEISEGELPMTAVEGVNDFGKTGYGGPKPPSGTHRYVFSLYALDSELNLPASVTSQEVEEAMEDHVIAKAELTGTYSAP